MILMQFVSSEARNSGSGYPSDRVGAWNRQTNDIEILEGVATVLELAQQALACSLPLQELVSQRLSGDFVAYDELVASGCLRPPISHPEPARCWVTGTGLTHLDAALARNKMAGGDDTHASDSLKMFRAGLAGGKPPPGAIGAQPEWYFKGNGASLVTTGQDLRAPSFAYDAGEEPEVAGVYLIDADGNPRRLGYVLANDFSDHLLESKSYLYVAASKLRCCALSPGLLLGDLPESVEGRTRITRGDAVVWERAFRTGEKHMSHSIRNLEYHHFKHDAFRRPGDIHIHLFGTAVFSYSDGVRKEPGDVFEIDAMPFGPPLANRLSIDDPANWRVVPL
jgi:hypothetical protein